LARVLVKSMGSIGAGERGIATGCVLPLALPAEIFVGADLKLSAGALGRIRTADPQPTVEIVSNAVTAPWVRHLKSGQRHGSALYVQETQGFAGTKAGIKVALRHSEHRQFNDL
jgi:hypothetical protein